MAFLPLFELAFTLLFAAFIATQVVWPIVKGEPWFPILRAPRGLEKQITNLNAEAEEIEMKTKIDALQQELEAKRAAQAQKKGQK